MRPDVRSRPLRIAVLFSLISPPAALQAGSAASFLVVQHTERLIVYNRYQQQASDQERGLLKPFSPIRIVRSNRLLSDGFTRCMEVESGDETYFLLLGKKGNLARTAPLGFEKTFRGVTIFLDTAQILTRETVRFSPIGRPAGFLRPGEKVVRIFSNPEGVYCLRTDSGFAYGWAELAGNGDGKNWRIVSTVATRRTSISPLIVDKVNSRIDDINRLLAQLFGHFNAETHQQKGIPRWEVQVARNSISCVLQGAPPEASFNRSTPYLVKDIENIVLGTALAVSYTPGRIDIRQP